METRRRDDSRQATNRLRAGVVLRRRGEAEELEAICDRALAYRLDEADLLDYGTEIHRDRDTRLPEKLIHPGGGGTPSVSEFLAMEVAALLRCSQTSAIERIASALNLKYRHPMLFEAVINGEVESWLAAKAAWLCRDLDPMQPETVTARWLPRQYGLVPSAALGELKKLIIRADAAAARAREAEARARRGVWLRDEEPGVTSIGGRLDVLDGRIVDERLHQISERLKARYPGLGHSARRAKALSLAMNPDLLLTILEADQPALGIDCDSMDGCLDHRGIDCTGPGDGLALLDSDCTSSVFEPVPPERPDEDDEPPFPDDEPPDWQPPDDPRLDRSGGVGPFASLKAPRQACAEPRRSARRPDRSPEPTRFPEPPFRFPELVEGRRAERGEDPPPHTALLDGAGTEPGLRGRRPATPPPPPPAPLPRVEIVVHITADADGTLDPIASVERADTLTTTLLGELLGDGYRNGEISLKVQPVIDLNTTPAADGYRPTRRMRKALRLLRPTEAFPFSTRTRRLDIDHNTTYQPGRPGQTRLDNLAQLCRRVHRGKTKGAWVLNQIAPGHFRWTSPLGYVYEVTSGGTWLECTPDLGPHLSPIDKTIQDWCDTIADDATTLARCG
ncbi:DUF222 domain-containing protein [Tessaracoccus palaemonis]|uniref:DUF222 domain-containing protein n=1 Tax=Tessaracoccus palaemonis TaxID=2829499 RepID=A0ABX8SLG0_9ACTN|nr:DUF222 domain-containing protein [Tessaracoccus palaemonis]QXT62039.1 DUF222 domain-containing protein [Tessaracoccus palaemonis]